MSSDNILARLWNGQESLAIAYWLFGVLIGNISGFLLVAVLGPVGLLFYIVYSFWVTVSIWRCAPNTTWVGWTYIARTLSVLGFLSFFSIFAQ